MMKIMEFDGECFYELEWNSKVCYIKNQIAQFMGISGEALGNFLRRNKNFQENTDYRVLKAPSEVAEFKFYLASSKETASLKMQFVSIMIIYPSGLKKIIQSPNYSYQIKVKEFTNFLNQMHGDSQIKLFTEKNASMNCLHDELLHTKEPDVNFCNKLLDLLEKMNAPDNIKLEVMLNILEKTNSNLDVPKIKKWAGELSFTLPQN